MNKPGDSDFRYLWPTRFLQRVVPGYQAPNSQLQNIILEQETDHKNFTADYKGQNFFAVQHPAVTWLKACVNKTVVDYMQQQDLGYSVNWTLQAWANINRRGDYHNLHNHPHSYLSGTYYIAVPTQPVGPPLRQDLNPGCISFFDPRAQANMNAIAGDGQVDAEHRVEPVPGMILLWPSFLHHFVHPNLSDAIRVSVSFNVILLWNDDFIPVQHS